MYQEIADIACNLIAAAITAPIICEHPVKALALPLTTLKALPLMSCSTLLSKTLFKTDYRRSHVNYFFCYSYCEAEFCRAAETNDRVRSYFKNQGLLFEVPYLRYATPSKYLPYFFVLVYDCRCDLLFAEPRRRDQVVSLRERQVQG